MVCRQLFVRRRAHSNLCSLSAPKGSGCEMAWAQCHSLGHHDSLHRRRAQLSWSSCRQDSAGGLRSHNRSIAAVDQQSVVHQAGASTSILLLVPRAGPRPDSRWTVVFRFSAR